MTERSFLQTRTDRRLKLITCNVWEQACADYVQKEPGPVNYHTIERSSDPEKMFICFNGGNRWQRMLFVAQLVKHNLHKRGYVSYNAADNKENVAQILSFYHKLQFTEQQTFEEYFAEHIADVEAFTSGEFSLNPYSTTYIDNDNIKSYQQASELDKPLYENSHFYVSTETAFSSVMCQNQVIESVSMPSHFLTEKTYRNIGLGMQFILLCRPGMLEVLRNKGYQTFHPYIDETYDTILDDRQRLDAVVAEISRLCSFSNNQWKQWHKEVDKITEHNYNIMLQHQTPEMTLHTV